MNELRKPSLSSRIKGDLFWLLAHLLGAKNVNIILGKNREALKKKLLEEMKIVGKRKQLQIKRVRGISLDDFRKNYLHACVPVILEGAAKDWNCAKNWSPQFLAQ